LTAIGSRLHAIRLVNLADALLAGPDKGADHIAELDDVLSRARETVEQLGDELGLAHVCTAQGRLLVARGDLDDAAKSLDQAAEIFRNRPDRSGQWSYAFGRAALQFATGQTASARNTLRAVLQECIDEDFPSGRSRVRQQWALFDPDGLPATGR
jgi:tetratricopeptide (TPR) repeat protein